jgi:ABC-type nickel/cobalt efflux system permease component RcnA
LTASLSEFLQSGASNAWVFVPSAVMLGALHGLEPGHSKTMMAAFIVAVRGTLGQAVLLGLSATASHTAIVWIIALAGLYFGSHWNTERTEPYLEIVSGVLILGVAAWMSWRNWRGAVDSRHPHGHDHHRNHDDDHDHGHDHGHDHDHDHFHESVDRSNNADARSASDTEDALFDSELLLVEPSTYADAHERAHAEEINRRFAHRQVTTGQIIVFGLTGGLIPCPASITVLLLCLQLGKFSLGAALVLCFSIGLALTMVLVGVAAAIGVRHVSARWSGLDAIAAKAPYFSSGLISLVGLYSLYLGVSALANA